MSSSISNFNQKRKAVLEVVYPASKRETLWTIVGIILLVFAVNFSFLFYSRVYSPNVAYKLIRVKWQMLLGLTHPVDALILGDSSGNNGIVPDVLKQELGIRSVNLCTAGALGLTNDAWMLETYIQRWGAPQFVIIIHTNEMWRYDYNLTAWSQIPVSFKQWNEFDPQPVRGFLNFLKMGVRKYFPLYSQNKTLRDLILHPKQLFAERRPFPIGPDGYTPVHKHYGDDFTDKAIQSHLQMIKANPFKMSDINRRGLEKLIELAEAHNLTIYLTHPAIYKGIWETDVFQSYYADVKRQLNEVHSRHKRLIYVPTSLTFDKENYDSLDHVLHPAALVYSQQLATVIKTAKDK